MSFATIVPAAVLETTLSHLAALFLTGAADDMTAARAAAGQMLDAYHPETEDEFRLAANIVGFSFQALQALGQAAMPDVPVTRVLRLRGGAVSLSRASEKAERRLEQVQKTRRQGVAAQPAETRPAPVQAEPEIAKTVGLIEDTSKVAALAKANGVTWSKAYELRQQDLRIAANVKKAEARMAAMSGTPVLVPPRGGAQSALSAAQASQ